MDISANKKSSPSLHTTFQFVDADIDNDADVKENINQKDMDIKRDLKRTREGLEMITIMCNAW